ncbi:MAG TPA: hypothetical protein VFO67_16510 [Gemmatimonadales bacterium]|nr:hypothetical protein [Gemmatimonadales bacterium]
MTTKQRLAARARRAVARVRVVGKLAAKRLIAAADGELVKQGKAAKARIRKRTVKAALKKVAKTVAFAGTAAATVIAARAMTRAASRRVTVRS